MTERRFFNGAERAALYLAADGKCVECGAELEPGWHADHEKPYSRGGTTDVVNGQALCPTCNLKKGSSMTKLRAWQERALNDLRQWRPATDKGFLVEATPGAGPAGRYVMTEEPVFGADDLVNALARSIRDRDHALKTVPALLRRTLETGAWRDFHTPLKEHVTWERFAEFVTAEPFAGLGADVDLIKRIVADDTEALDLLDQALQNPAHVHADVNNSNVRPTGTSKDYALRKLRKDAPELHADVLAGNLTAHAAMVKAGFRPPTFTVRADNPRSVAEALRRRLDANQIAELARLLAEG